MKIGSSDVTLSRLVDTNCCLPLPQGTTIKMETADFSVMLVEYLPEYRVSHPSREYSSTQCCVNSESFLLGLVYSMLVQNTAQFTVLAPQTTVVTILYATCLNSAFCLHNIFMYFLWFSQYTAIICLNSIKWLG
jgi:hypothetical protein